MLAHILMTLVGCTFSVADKIPVNILLGLIIRILMIKSNKMLNLSIILQFYNVITDNRITFVRNL